MPAGVDFICKNEDCECFNKSITIISAWPIAKIEEVIETIKDEDYKRMFESAKDNGQKYACIQFPNEKNINMVGWKIQSWCENCPRIGEDEVLLEESNEKFESAISNNPLTKNCLVCNHELKSFDDLLEGGMCCPFCNKEMVEERWFAKEVSESRKQ